jgi:dihydrofolate reductase
MKFELVVACDDANAIGSGGGLPWRVPEDLARFRRLTLGHCLLMGRATWESIPVWRRPLAGRHTIVLTSTPDEIGKHENVTATDLAGLASALCELAEKHTTCFVCGGAKLYELMLPRCETLHITRVHGTHANCDTFFACDTSDYVMTFKSYGDSCSFERWNKKRMRETGIEPAAASAIAS